MAEVYQEAAQRNTTGSVLALAAAAKGYAVFPLSGKIPAIKGGKGFKDAATERSRIISMFNAAPDATGYGIATGSPSRVIVVDADGPEALAEAKRLGLTDTGRVVQTGRGQHFYFTIPASVVVRSRELAPKLDLKADGGYVAGPGSLHPSGKRYTFASGGEPKPAPDSLLEPSASEAESDSRPRESLGPVSIDTAGEPIGEGGRNKALARIAGRLHDGTRSLDELERDLMAINAARCTPPLERREVRSIAESIHRRKPCKAKPKATAKVREMVDDLREAARHRAIRGRAGATGWAIYHAGLEHAERHGIEHSDSPADGFTIALDSRTWAQMAGTTRSTVTRWLKDSRLVEVLEPGKGRRPATVRFVVPRSGSRIGCHMHHLSTYRDRLEEPAVRSGANNTLFRNLYRTRWSERPRKPKRGCISGTRMVRQGITPGREGRGRMGKSKAALLDLISRHSGATGASRKELARLKGVKPASLTHPLRWLMEAGLIVRTGRGCYAPVDALDEKVSEARDLAGEPEADRQQIIDHALERVRYHYRETGEAQPVTVPAEAGSKRTNPEPPQGGIGHWVGFLHGEAADRAAGRTPEKKTGWSRVEELVEAGMRRAIAAREVFGPDSPEYREAKESA
jgi:Bifunctional DNA primase/polymerase, N-terminal/Primase C terminal 1 (PriCT-1)